MNDPEGNDPMNLPEIRHWRAVMSFAAAVLVLSPLAHAQGGADKPVSFKDDVQPLLNSQCVFCHVTGAENAGLNLGRRDSHAALMAASTQAPMPRVTPGDPAKSYLVHKLKHNTNLLLLRCDVGLNEVEEKLGFVIKPTPKIVFFRNRMKNYAIHYTAHSISTRGVIDFIMENTTFDFEDEWAEL